jgi:hypothetical protein
VIIVLASVFFFAISSQRTAETARVGYFSKSLSSPCI